MEKYGPFYRSINRASDGPDSDIEREKEAIRSRVVDVPKTRRDLIDKPVGRKWLVRQRSIAEYEARKRPDWNKAAFDKCYPPYSFDHDDSDDYDLEVHIICYIFNVTERFMYYFRKDSAIKIYHIFH